MARTGIDIIHPDGSTETWYATSVNAGGTEVEANPTMVGDEDPLTGIDIGGTNYNVTEVEANPTLVGTEDALTGIDIDGTKYKVNSTTYRAFPSGWGTSSSYTTAQFCAQVNADSSAIQGMSYLGEVLWSDLPAGIGNAEVVVDVMSGTGTSGKVIHITLTSGNVNPYRWEYTYWNDGANTSGWIAFQTKIGVNPTLAGTEANVTGIEVDGTKYALGYLPTAGGRMTGSLTFASNTSIRGVGDNAIVNFPNNTSANVSIGSRNAYGDFIIQTNEGATLYHRYGDSGAYPILDTYNSAANPTLAGTETALTGLKLNGTSYSVLPSVSSGDEGKFLIVDSNGKWAATTVPNANGNSF